MGVISRAWPSTASGCASAGSTPTPEGGSTSRSRSALAEVAETGLYRKVGLLREGRGDYPRRHVEADYLRVLVFEDEVELRIRVDEVGRTSIRFVWEAIHEGEVAIAGSHTIVQVDADGRPFPIDDRARALLTG